MRSGAEFSGPTSRTRDQTGVGPLLVSQETVWPSPDSRTWSGTVDEWLPRRRTARGRPEAGGRLADAGWGAGGQAGAVRGLSRDTILAAVDLTTCLFPANPQSPLIDSFHAALQIARALCSVPPHIAVPEHAVLDLWTVGRSAHGVTREQLAALRGAHRHLDRRDGDQGAVAAEPSGHRAKSRDQHVESANDTKLGMAILSHSHACLLPCAMLPSREPHDRASQHSLYHHDTCTAPLMRAHTIPHAQCHAQEEVGYFPGQRGTSFLEGIHLDSIVMARATRCPHHLLARLTAPFSESARLRLTQQEQCRAAR